MGKLGNCITVVILIAFLIGGISMLSPTKQVSDVEVVEVTQQVNRLEMEDWEPCRSVVREDGSINWPMMKNQANEMAKVLYGTARNNSDQQKETVAWCIVNRLDNPQFPDTIYDVCSQPNQFKGYSDSNPVLEDLSDICYDVLREYYLYGNQSGEDFVYMYVDDYNVLLRNTWDKSENTVYWCA